MSNLEIMWSVFIVTAVALFSADLKLSSGKAHEISRKESMLLCGFWVLIASLFGLLTGYMLGREKMLEFFTGYIIEYSLSMDNMFVFLLIFSYFAIPKKYQPKILTWGILGAVIMRLVLIFAGIGLLNAFHWLIYVFGAILIFTAVKMLMHDTGNMDPGKNPVLKLFSKLMPFDNSIDTPLFFIKKEIWYATPLLATLIVVETSDVIFAVDSIPAVLAISTDKFVVYTSNVFAVVGLRSLYFFLAAIIDSFRFLKTGISVILFYVGAKMLLSNLIHIPAILSLAVVLGLLGASILLSVAIKDKGQRIANS
ncbi:MAG TPA: tellurium resistance protein TerC [Elusimicrobia bacterium]|nr:tellurium resistance protein TerC [Elusimicrobiota bacterium]